MWGCVSSQGGEASGQETQMSGQGGTAQVRLRDGVFVRVPMSGEVQPECSRVLRRLLPGRGWCTTLHKLSESKHSKTQGGCTSVCVGGVDYKL